MARVISRRKATANTMPGQLPIRAESRARAQFPCQLYVQHHADGCLGLFQSQWPTNLPGAYLQSIGIRRDYQQADFAVRHLAHFSGGYDLPFGPGRQFLAQKGDVTGKVAGGWSLNWIFTYASGQPLTIPCTITTAAGVGCDAFLVQGAHQSGGPHNANQYWNPSSFYNPPLVVSTGRPILLHWGALPRRSMARTSSGSMRLCGGVFRLERMSGSSSVRKLTMY